ncbi:MAG: radical SAM protein, partial [Armatimonadetes bacterium]|nr:radical SAM protein [Armatimonadota bacterium]
GIHVALETCGVARWEIFERLLPVIDLFLYDLKHPDPEAHRELTGGSLSRVLDNLAHLIAAGADVVVRVPLIPGINDGGDMVRATARLAAERGVGRITLLPYNPATPGKYSWVRREPPLPGARKQDAQELARLEDVCRDEGLQIEPA